MRRPLGELLFLAAVTAAVGGIAGRIAAHLGWVWIHADWVGRIPEAEHVDFLTVLWIHNGSYHGGLVGGVLLAVRTWRRRKRGEGRA